MVNFYKFMLTYVRFKRSRWIMINEYLESQYNETLKETMIDDIKLSILDLSLDDLTAVYELINGKESFNTLNIELKMEILNNE